MCAHWGVDSATKVTNELYHYVMYNFGKPEFWGRSLSTVQGRAEGLTKEEVELLHNNGTKVLPIYNGVKEAVGYQQGRTVGINTIFHARRLAIPEGTILFASVEPFVLIDEEWIRGYVDVLIPCGYRSGIYYNPVQGDFNIAYCNAIRNDPKVANQLILWSAAPELEATKRSESPPFNPIKPSCRANVWGWQYSRDIETHSFDTNLIERKLYNLLW